MLRVQQPQSVTYLHTQRIIYLSFGNKELLRDFFLIVLSPTCAMFYEHFREKFREAEKLSAGCCSKIGIKMFGKWILRISPLISNFGVYREFSFSEIVGIFLGKDSLSISPTWHLLTHLTQQKSMND